jgi:hypothetical protein
MSQQDFAAPALIQLTVEASVREGLGYPNHRIDGSIVPTGWLNNQPENLMSIGNSTQSLAGKTESGS